MVKARIHSQLGQNIPAMAIYRQVDKAFAAEERRGPLTADDHLSWIETITNMGGINLASHQLETAKFYYLRVLAWPGGGAIARLTALDGMAIYYKERKEWIPMTECCEKALALLPDAKKDLLGEAEMAEKEFSIPLMLVDALKGKGT